LNRFLVILMSAFILLEAAAICLRSRQEQCQASLSSFGNATCDRKANRSGPAKYPVYRAQNLTGKQIRHPDTDDVNLSH
jgi:hypothetical protein